jgi:hypothetical protein
MKRLIALCFSLLASIAAAQPFDEKLCTTILADGKPHSEGCVTFHGLTLQDLQQHRARLVPIMKAASNMKDSGGPYTVTLTETTIDTAAGTKGGAGDMTFTGLKLQEAAKLARLGFKASDTAAAAAEASGLKGHKHPWGPNKDG